MAINTFTRRLKEARKLKGLSQKQLGIEAGIDPSSASPRMNQYETGKHSPDSNMTKSLCSILGIPTAYLYCEDDGMAKLILAYYRSPPEQRNKILKYYLKLIEEENHIFKS